MDRALVSAFSLADCDSNLIPRGVPRLLRKELVKICRSAFALTLPHTEFRVLGSEFFSPKGSQKGIRDSLVLSLTFLSED